MRKQKETHFIESPAEDADLTLFADSVDLIFTSPPYFSVERYSYDDTQSWVRHKNIDRWNEDFLHKALNNVLTTLKKGGLLMVNISDVNATSQGTKGGKQWLKICDPMNEYLQSRGDMQYVECFGMEMAKRPNCLELVRQMILKIAIWMQNITNEKEVLENQCGFGKKTEYI